MITRLTIAFRPLVPVALVLALILPLSACGENDGSGDTAPGDVPEIQDQAHLDTDTTGDVDPADADTNADVGDTHDAEDDQDPGDLDVSPDSEVDSLDADLSDVDALDADADVPPNPPEALKILFIGNSFTLGGPVPVIVDNLANSAGWPDPNVEWSAFGGETLEGHRGRQQTMDLVDQGGWDVVVLQEYSTRPTDNLGDPAQFKTDATYFYDRIQASSPGARVILYETWARHPDHSFFPGSFSNPAEMQAQLRFHYNDAADNYIPANATSPNPMVEVAPVGDAWEVHLAEQNPLRLHASDDYHAGANGQYLNGLVIYSTIYHRAATGLGVFGVGGAEGVRLQTTADAVTGETIPGGPDGMLPEVGLEPGQRVQIDFGNMTTADPGWTNLGDPVGGAVFNLTTVSGGSSSVDVVISDAFVGNNNQGLANNTLGYPADVSSDTIWTGSFDGHAAALGAPGQLTVRDLDPAARYDLTLFASRSGNDGGNGRLTRYSVNGVVDDLEVSDNVSNVAAFLNVAPDAGGQIVIDVAVSPAGSSRFAYVGVLELARR